MDIKPYMPVAARVMAQVKAFDTSFTNPDEFTIAAWAEIFAEWNLSQEILLDAVKQIYRTRSSDQPRPLPADIVKVARAIRADRLERSALDSPERLALEARSDAKAAPDDDPEVIEAKAAAYHDMLAQIASAKDVNNVLKEPAKPQFTEEDRQRELGRLELWMKDHPDACDTP